MKKENVDKDFMRLQLYDNETSFELGDKYTDDIIRILTNFKDEMQNITNFLNNSNLAILGFDITPSTVVATPP